MHIPPPSSAAASVATGLARAAQSPGEASESAGKNAANQPKPIEAESEAALKLDIAGSISPDREANRQLPQWFSGAHAAVHRNGDDEQQGGRDQQEGQNTNVPLSDDPKNHDPDGGKQRGLNIYG